MAEASDVAIAAAGAAVASPDAKKDPLSTKSGKASPHNSPRQGDDLHHVPYQPAHGGKDISEVEQLRRDVDRLTKMNDQLAAELQASAGRRMSDAERRSSLEEYDIDYDEDYDDDGGPSPLTSSKNIAGNFSTKSNPHTPSMKNKLSTPVTKTDTAMSRVSSLKPGVAPVSKEEIEHVRRDSKHMTTWSS